MKKEDYFSSLEEIQKDDEQNSQNLSLQENQDIFNQSLNGCEKYRLLEG